MRAGIIGPGRVSTEHIKAYGECGIDVVAVCGRTIESARRKIQEMDLQARSYDNLDEMLWREELDCLSICSPQEHHATHIIQAARQRIRPLHLVIEKPIVHTASTLTEVCRAVSDARIITMVCFVLRWNELVQNIKNSMKKIGTIKFFEICYWNGPSHEKPPVNIAGKMTLDTIISGGCHAVDMARFLLDTDIVSVSAITPAEENEFQRTTSALVKCRNGASGMISATSEAFMPYLFNIVLLGDRGAIFLNKIYSESSEYSKSQKHKRPFLESFETIPGIIPERGEVLHHPFPAMMREFADCVRNGKDTSCNLADALNTHKTCFAAIESARRGGKTIVIR